MTSSESWRSPCRISSPALLADVLRRVADAVQSGDLRQLAPSDEPFATKTDVREIPPNGPWPDFIDIRFVESGSGRHYRLFAETYRGAGGVWEMIE